jgi:hypothetical protein
MKWETEVRRAMKEENPASEKAANRQIWRKATKKQYTV